VMRSNIKLNVSLLGHRQNGRLSTVCRPSSRFFCSFLFLCHCCWGGIRSNRKWNVRTGKMQSVHSFSHQALPRWLHCANPPLLWENRTV
jgi:hypothetical protein